MTKCKPQPVKRKHAIYFTEPSMAQQHQRDAVDINNIMKRYVKTGIIDHINKNAGHYGDIPALSYHEAIDQVMRADEMFLELPSQVRKHFENDPSKFLAYVQDPVNADSLHEMGLTNRVPEQPTETPTANAPASPENPSSDSGKGDTQETQ